MNSQNFTGLKFNIFCTAAVLFFFCAFIDFALIEADADITITNSPSFFSDEGLHAGNPINKILLDDWAVSKHNHIKHMPVIPLLQYMFYKSFGLSLASTRIPSIVLSYLAIFALMGFIWIAKDGRTTVIVQLIGAALLVLIDYDFFMYRRVAFLDIPMFTFGLLALLVFFGRKKLKLTDIWATVLISTLLLLCLLTKTSGIVFFFAAAIYSAAYVLLNGRKSIRDLRVLFASIAFSIVAFIVYRLVIDSVLEFPDDGYMKGLLALRVPHFSNYYAMLSSTYVQNNLLFILLALLSTLIIGFAIVRNRLKHQLDLFFITLFLAIFLLFGAFSYQPPRYFVIASIPMIYLLVRLTSYVKPSSSVVLIGLLFVVFTPKFSKLSQYVSRPKHVLVSTAQEIREDIAKTTRFSSPREVAVIGSHRRIMSAINHLPFESSSHTKHIFRLIPNPYNSRYLAPYNLEDLPRVGPEELDELLEFKHSYLLYRPNKWGDLGTYLYRDTKPRAH